MSLMPPPDNWIPEEPPDLHYREVDVLEPPDWAYRSSIPDVPPDLFPPMDEEGYWLARLDQYAPPPIPPAEDYPIPDVVYADTVLDADPLDIPTWDTQPPASEAVERQDTWQLQDSGILIEAIRDSLDTDPTSYRVGVAEIWADLQTGDQTGTYLHMADAPHLERAAEMRDNIYRLADERDIPDHEFGDFTHELIKGRGDWQPLTDSQWNIIDKPPASDTPDLSDDAIWAARDRMLAQAFELGDEGLQREEVDQEVEVQQVIRGMGIQIEDFDPATTPPPLFDETTGKMYWVGVYQPDPHNPHEAITSILSIGADENGQTQAHLAPVATGDLDHAQRTAEYLLKVAERIQDMGQFLDAAESMAVATQHRELWETTQGIVVNDDISFSPVGMDIE